MSKPFYSGSIYSKFTFSVNINSYFQKKMNYWYVVSGFLLWIRTIIRSKTIVVGYIFFLLEGMTHTFSSNWHQLTKQNIFSFLKRSRIVDIKLFDSMQLSIFGNWTMILYWMTESSISSQRFLEYLPKQWCLLNFRKKWKHALWNLNLHEFLIMHLYK